MGENFATYCSDASFSHIKRVFDKVEGDGGIEGERWK